MRIERKLEPPVPSTLVSMWARASSLTVGAWRSGGYPVEYSSPSVSVTLTVSVFCWKVTDSISVGRFAI